MGHSHVTAVAFEICDWLPHQYSNLIQFTVEINMLVICIKLAPQPETSFKTRDKGQEQDSKTELPDVWRPREESRELRPQSWFIITGFDN